MEMNGLFAQLKGYMLNSASPRLVALPPDAAWGYGEQYSRFAETMAPRIFAVFEGTRCCCHRGEEIGTLKPHRRSHVDAARQAELATMACSWLLDAPRPQQQQSLHPSESQPHQPPPPRQQQPPPQHQHPPPPPPPPPLPQEDIRDKRVYAAIKKLIADPPLRNISDCQEQWCSVNTMCGSCGDVWAYVEKRLHHEEGCKLSTLRRLILGVDSCWAKLRCAYRVFPVLQSPPPQQQQQQQPHHQQRQHEGPRCSRSSSSSRPPPHQQHPPPPPPPPQEQQPWIHLGKCFLCAAGGKDATDGHLSSKAHVYRVTCPWDYIEDRVGLPAANVDAVHALKPMQRTQAIEQQPWLHLGKCFLCAVHGREATEGHLSSSAHLHRATCPWDYMKGRVGLPAAKVAAVNALNPLEMSSQERADMYNFINGMLLVTAPTELIEVLRDDGMLLTFSWQYIAKYIDTVFAKLRRDGHNVPYSLSRFFVDNALHQHTLQSSPPSNNEELCTALKLSPGTQASLAAVPLYTCRQCNAAGEVSPNFPKCTEGKGEEKPPLRDRWCEKCWTNHRWPDSATSAGSDDATTSDDDDDAQPPQQHQPPPLSEPAQQQQQQPHHQQRQHEQLPGDDAEEDDGSVETEMIEAVQLCSWWNVNLLPDAKAVSSEAGRYFKGDGDASGWACKHCIKSGHVDGEVPEQQSHSRVMCALCAGMAPWFAKRVIDNWTT